MKPFLNKGKLTTWKDDRGFGFIKPDDGSREVFLHISVLKKANRRPQVGDLILYDLVVEVDGKVRAAKAKIQGVETKPFSTKQKQSKQDSLKITGGIVISCLITLLAIEFNPRTSPSLLQSLTKPECKIKGNISVKTKNKIYHLPGMEDYESTVIDPSKGEKWFCSESEAISNGYRKAPN